ncbi:MAG: histidinol-phosphate transaminase [Cyanobacteria bacterium P01_F01_bin.33]
MDYLRPSLLDLQPYESIAAPHAAKLDANEYPADLPEWFKKKLSLVWEKGIPSHRYPDGNHRSLKRAIASYAGVDPNQISIGNGSDELIRSLLIATCLEQRGSILVATPTFSMYAIVARTLGVPVVSIPRHHETFACDIAACQRAIAEDEIRAVFLVSPNSPTGTPVAAETWDWARSLPESILVVVDEAYFEFTGKTVVAELARHPNWVVLRTFSKAFRLAAHRVGYAIANPALIRVLEAIRLPYNLPTLSQWAVQLALENADELLAGVPPLLRERDRLYAALQGMPGVRVWPSAANFLYWRADGWDLDDLQQALARSGTAIRHTGGGLRLTVGTPAENDGFISGLQAVLSGS